MTARPPIICNASTASDRCSERGLPRSSESGFHEHPGGVLRNMGVAAFGRKPHYSIIQGLRRSAETPLRWMSGFAVCSSRLPNDLGILLNDPGILSNPAGRLSNDLGRMPNDLAEMANDLGILAKYLPEMPNDLGRMAKYLPEMANDPGILSNDLPEMVGDQPFLAKTGF